MMVIQPERKRFILLDRDGVINVDRTGSVCRLPEFSFISGARRAIRTLCDKGYKVVVITNQACIGRGDTDLDTVAAIHHHMTEQIIAAGGLITDIFLCPHAHEEGCTCRKPSPGLIVIAQKRYGFNPEETLFVGDAARDVEAAYASGCRPVLVRTGYGIKTAVQHPEVPLFDDLFQLSVCIGTPEFNRLA